MQEARIHMGNGPQDLAQAGQNKGLSDHSKKDSFRGSLKRLREPGFEKNIGLAPSFTPPM